MKIGYRREVINKTRQSVCGKAKCKEESRTSDIVLLQMAG